MNNIHEENTDIKQLATNSQSLRNVSTKNNEIEITTSHVSSSKPKLPRVLTLHNPKHNGFRLLSSCCWQFVFGFGDACLGALLPTMEAYYHINYTIISTIWLGLSCGFLLVAFSSHYISKYVPFYQSVIIPPVLQIIQYSMIASGTVFPVIVVAYFIGGIALAMGMSSHNFYVSKFENNNIYLGILHGSYGIGAIIGPLIGTFMVSRNVKWHFFFLIQVGLSIWNLIFLLWSYRNSNHDWDRSNDEIDDKKEEEDVGRSTSFKGDDTREYSEQIDEKGKSQVDVESRKKKSRSDFSASIRLIGVWLLAFFTFFYQGAEVGYGSWIVTYFLEYRHANSKTAGYIASGFWAGITISRFTVIPIALKYLGNRRTILLLSIFSILFDIVSWLVDNVYVGGLMAAFCGVCVGPCYPLMIANVSKIIPRRSQVTSLTILSALGTSGAAIFPFVIGIMSQHISTYVLHPIFISLIISMLVTWVCLPNVERIEREGSPKNLWQYIW